MPALLIDTLTNVPWEAWPAPLRADERAVFRYKINPEDQPWLLGWLSTDERDRANQFRQLTDRQRFIAGRGCLRWLAGRLLGTLPGVVALEQTGPGQYRITATPDTDLRAAIFRLAADRSLVLVGLRQQQQSLEGVFKELTK